jgi:hypothetical protein
MFYEKRTKKGLWFGSSSSEVCWEQWAITINIVTNVNEKGMLLATRCEPEEPHYTRMAFRVDNLTRDYNTLMNIMTPRQAAVN